MLRLDLLFVRSPPPAEPKGARSAGPIGVRGSVSPTSLVRQVGGGEGEDNGVDQALFEEVSPYREANDRKAKLPKFEQSVKFFKLSSSNDLALYGKPVRGGTNSWLVAPLLCFESAQQLKCATSSRNKVSRRKWHRQQAADVPHSALVARVPAPTSSLEA